MAENKKNTKPKNGKIRIQKALSDCGYTSRRKAEELVMQGKIKINGHPATIGALVNPDRDVITVNGERVMTGGRKQRVYIALNKPRGYVTSMNDELGRRTVDELVKDLGTRVYPVGRLDRNSEGLLLMTNDGEFANQMMHPRYKVSKVYRVTVRSGVTDDQVTKLASGVMLDDRMTEPCEVVVEEKTNERSVMRIVLQEGRNRQVRRMCESVGLEVARLRRTAIGAVKLGVLQPGEYRHLTARELELLRSRISSQDAQRRADKDYKEPQGSKLSRNFGKDEPNKGRIPVPRFRPQEEEKKNTHGKSNYAKSTAKPQSGKKKYYDEYEDYEDYGITKKIKSDKWYDLKRNKK